MVGRRTIKISGMHCQNCVNSVTNALNAIDGVVAKVELKDNSAEVSYDRTVDEIELKNAVEKSRIQSNKYFMISERKQDFAENLRRIKTGLSVYINSKYRKRQV